MNLDASEIIATVALVISVLSWRASHRAAKANEDMAASNRRMADAAERSNRMAVDAHAREQAAYQRAQVARFQLHGALIRSDDEGFFHIELRAENVGAHRARDLQVGFDVPGQDPKMTKPGRPVEPHVTAPFPFRRRLKGQNVVFNALLTFQDGIGKRSQTFTVPFRRDEDGSWYVDDITETMPDAQ